MPFWMSIENDSINLHVTLKRLTNCNLIAVLINTKGLANISLIECCMSFTIVVKQFLLQKHERNSVKHQNGPFIAWTFHCYLRALMLYLLISENYTCFKGNDKKVFSWRIYCGSFRKLTTKMSFKFWNCSQMIFDIQGCPLFLKHQKIELKTTLILLRLFIWAREREHPKSKFLIHIIFERPLFIKSINIPVTKYLTKYIRES